MPKTDFITVHASNPNDRTGGGGCLAAGGKYNEDCAGRWLNFWRATSEEYASPYVTICEHHFAEVNANWNDLEVAPADDVLPIRSTKATPVTDAGLEPITPTPYVKLAG